MPAILTALATLIQPAINYLEQKLASIGAAFLSSLAVIANTFTNDQRIIGANCIAFWQAHYHANAAAGMNILTAAETASTATLNEFAAEEGSEASKIASLVTTALELAVKNGASA